MTFTEHAENGQNPLCALNVVLCSWVVADYGGKHQKKQI